MRTKGSKTRTTQQRGLYSQTRAVSIAPTTLDEKTRSVEAIAATEAPVPMPDYERGMMIPEVLLMSGLRIPADKALPLQDSHRTSSVFFTLGSFVNLHVAGENYQGRATFSEDEDGDKAFKKVKGGHVKKFSVGYWVYKSVFVPENETQVINGRSFVGPIRVVTDWEAYEVSLTAFPADGAACARTEPEKIPETKVIPSAKRADTKTGGSSSMNKWLRFILITRGLAEDSTPEAAQAYFDALSPEQQQAVRTQASVAEKAVANGGKDPEAEQRAVEEGRKLEAARQTEIRAMCQVPGCEDLAEGLCKDTSVTPEMASRKVIERMKETRKPVGTKIDLVIAEGDKFRMAAIDGMLIREGVKVANPAPGHEDFLGIKPTRLAEECLRSAGINTRRMSMGDIVRMALLGSRGSEVISHGTSHFPYILENIATKMTLMGFQEEEEIWPLLCAVKDVSDFREFSITGLSGAEDLEEIKELAPYTEGEFNERREKASLAKYGKKFTISWEGMLADKLEEFTTIPRRHGQAAKRLLNKLAITILTANAAMSDGKALFHADHGNILTAAALSSPALSDLEALMGKQTGHGKDAEPLDIPLSRLVTGRQLKRTAQILCISETLPEAGMPNGVPNPNKGIVPVSTGLITSDTAFYGAADPNKYDVMVMAFLDGKRAPDLEQIMQTDVDGIAFKVRQCAVAKAADWKGLAYCAGAAS